MGGFVPGPVVQFRFDEAGFLASAQSSLKKIQDSLTAANKSAAQQITSQIAEPLSAQAAKLRALFSTGAIGIKDLQVQQKLFLTQLDQEISKLVTRNDLTVKQLSTLKQLTLERERQANALSRGTGVGVTAGTQSALSLVSGPIVANIARLGTSLLGVSGASGVESTVFSGAASGLSAIAAEGGITIGILAGVTTGLLAAGGAAAALAISGGQLVEELSNISQRTGISIRDLQVLQAAGATVGVGLDDLVTGFRKFSQSLTGGDATNEDGTSVAGGANKGAQALKLLGVTSKDSFTALSQLADAFQKLPDGPTKSAVAINVLGRSGLQLIPILNKGASGIEQFRTLVDQFGPTIDKNAIDSQERWRISTERLSLQYDNFKVHLIPIVDLLSSLFEKTGGLIDFAFKTPLAGNPFGFLAGNSSGTSTPDGIAKSFSIADAVLKKFSGTSSATKKALDDLLSGKTEALQKLIEEGTKELQALDEEANKSAISKLGEITSQAQTSGLSASGKVLEEQRQKLEVIADIMLNFPQLASQVGGAVAALAKSTIGQLTILADAELKRRDDQNEADEAARIRSQNELAGLIRGSEDQLAIDRAAATQSGVAQIIAEEQKRLDETIAKAVELGATETQLQNLRVSIVADANARIQKLQEEQLKKISDGIKSEAGSLFDALLKGGRNFTTAIGQSFEKIALTPVKNVFENFISGILAKPFQNIEKTLSGVGASLQKRGGILGRFGGAIAGADGTNPDVLATGLNTTATITNTAALTALTGALAGTGSGAAANGLGVNILGTGGQLIPASQAGSLFGAAASGNGIADLSSFATSPHNALNFGALGDAGGVASGSSSNNIFSALGVAGPLIGGIASLLGGNHSTAQLIGGTAGVAGGALAGIGKLTGSSGLGAAGGILGGIGTAISGIAAGGVGGALQAGLGGALAGASLGSIVPGLGTAIGAVVGGIAGLLGAGIHDLFGPSKAQLIARAVTKQSLSQFQIDSLQGQTFDRAFGSNITQTENSTFSEAPGGFFSSSFGPGVAQAGDLLNNPINPPKRRDPKVPININIAAIDAKGVADFFTQHGTTVAQILGGQVNSTQSGLARAVRTAVSPA